MFCSIANDKFLVSSSKGTLGSEIQSHIAICSAVSETLPTCLLGSSEGKQGILEVMTVDSIVEYVGVDWITKKECREKRQRP